MAAFLHRDAVERLEMARHPVSLKDHSHDHDFNKSQGSIHICGYDIPAPRGAKWSSSFVQTETSVSNMKYLVQSVLTSRPIVVQGSIGSGKSYLIRELAAAMGHRDSLIELHINDQTDSKSLIGSYICSDIPGEFVWQSGIITQAVQRGQWLIIEDIDKVPLEFIASISTLLEFRRLHLPHRNLDIVAHPNFRLFGTRSLPMGALGVDGHSQKFKNSDALVYVSNMRHYSHLWHFVSVFDCTLAEIKNILNA
eukprot:gene34827-42950_t